MHASVQSVTHQILFSSFVAARIMSFTSTSRRVHQGGWLPSATQPAFFSLSNSCQCLDTLAPTGSSEVFFEARRDSPGQHMSLLVPPGRARSRQTYLGFPSGIARRPQPWSRPVPVGTCVDTGVVEGASSVTTSLTAVIEHPLCVTEHERSGLLSCGIERVDELGRRGRA